MSTDWSEKEREFLISLKADTGRDLGQWMRVIAAQNLPHRNDIIDWLRQQGFAFSRASWLERIHHNQGRPIYCDLAEITPAAGVEEICDDSIELGRVAVAGGGRVAMIARGAGLARAADPAGQRPVPPVAEQAASTPRAMPPPRLATETPLAQLERATDAAESAALDGDATHTASEYAAAAANSAPRVEPASMEGVDDAPLATVSASASSAAAGPPYVPAKCELSRDDILAKAKAYRPLAQHLIARIEASNRDIAIAPAPGYLELSTEAGPFGLVAISAKDIRLVLRLSPEVVSAPFVAVKLPVAMARAAHAMTHMAVLTDARQLDEALINHVQMAILASTS